MKSKPVPFRKQLDAAPEVLGLSTTASTEARVIAALRTVYDPEISVNIYDLGLIYEIKIDADTEVFISMTLTSPACPVAGILPGQAVAAIEAIEGISQANVKLVWEPPWDQDCMSDEAKLELGLF